MNKLQNLKPSKNIKQVFGLSGLEIQNVKILHTNITEVIIFIEVNNVKKYDELEKIDGIISRFLSEYNNLYKLSYNIKFKDISSKKDVVKFIIEQILIEKKSYKLLLANYSLIVDDNNISILINHDDNIRQLKELNFKYEILKKLQYIYVNSNFKVEYFKDDTVIELKEKIKEDAKKEVIENIDKTLIIDLEVGKNISSTGEIFNIDSKEIMTKQGEIKYIYDFYITDYNKSVICRKFYNSTEKVEFQVGDIVEFNGKYTQSTFRDITDYYISVRSMKKIGVASNIITDDAEVKRVELAMKTNMSELYSNINCKKITKIMMDMGYSAYAVTDLAVVHAFPFVCKEISDKIKVILGVEAYVVDDSSKLVVNPKNVILEEENYVIFDIETTGFDPYTDKIIEIGAIKMKNMEVIDRFSHYVNPQMPIPKKITEITNISDDDVKDADSIEIVLDKFLEFCKDSTLVAHNADFDIKFISEKSRQLNIKTNFSYIDTINWARLCLPTQRSYSLKALCKHFEIELENHHRAIYDAEATAKLFKILLQKVSIMNVNTLEDVNNVLQLDITKSPVLRTNILVKNKKGLRDLYELVSKAHLEYYGDLKPRIPKSLLEKFRENLLIASTPVYNFKDYGELMYHYVRGTDKEEIEEIAKFYDYIQIFPTDTYVKEVETDEIKDYKFIEEMNIYLYNLGKKLGKKVIASSNPMYMEKKDNIVKSILQMEKNRNFKSDKSYMYANNTYFRTTKQMLNDFSYLGEKEAYEVVVDNTNYIADLIDYVKPIPDGFYPPKIEGADEEVKKLSYTRARELYGDNIPEIIEKRLEKELNSIINNGFSVLYLIAQKLVKKSLDNGYLVGSRGSVGSSLVAYLMGITEVNGLAPHYRCPNVNCKNIEIFEMEISGVDLDEKDCPKCGTEYIRDGHAILFEVFMGFNGDKVPDIDLNFSGEFQAEVHKYTEELFGSDFVFRAGTISTTAEKTAWSNVRSYYEKLNAEFLAEESIKQFGNFDEKNESQKNFRKNLIDKIFEKEKAEVQRLVKSIEGVRRTTGQHPGGMIVIPNDKSIYDFTPIQKPANDMNDDSITTHFDYHVMESQLVKLDILGHDDPTTLKMLEDLTGIDSKTLPLNDKKVLSLFSSTDALNVKAEDIGTDLGSNGIPELGTEFVKGMLRDTKPTTFTELVKISGLSHGTDVWNNNAKDYINNKVATLNEVITVRDDIMNYLILQGMDSAKAFKIMEFIRKGLPSKQKDIWEQHKQAMKELGIKPWYIESCEKIKYMFPKGHAVAYVMMAVRIAYFKVYYPLEFYTAYLNRKIDSFKLSTMFADVEFLKERLFNLNTQSNKTVNDKKEIILIEILIEMYYRGIELLPVDLYKSQANTFIIENNKIRIPFIAVDQLGEVVANKIITERNIREFTSKENLINRTGLNKSIIQTLSDYGILNTLNETDQQSLF